MEVTSSVEEAFSAELLQAIGLLIVVAGGVENALTMQAARLMAHPKVIDPAIVTALAGASTRVSLQQVKILARLRFAPDLAKQVVAQCERIGKAYDHRNELAHFVIMPGQSGDGAVLRTTKLNADGILKEAKPYTVAQIRGFATTLQAHARTLDTLLTGAGVPRFTDFVESMVPGAAE